MCRLPVRWDKTVIVVMDQVRVCSPYLPESVAGGTPAANERVRKVVRQTRVLIFQCMRAGVLLFYVSFCLILTHAVILFLA